MLGIDIYDRYQDVTDWQAVRDHGVRFVITKGTDGGGRAAVWADAFVRGARSVGLPVGLYHYAELTPTPEAQADVLHAEVQRLAATGVPPALDLEGPFHPLSTDSAAVRAQKIARAVDFAQRFLRRLRLHYPRVMLYANTSFLSQLRPDTWGIPGLMWPADYGPNDGVRHPDLSPWHGPADIHQYTDKGRVPGIPGYVDLNWSLTDIFATEEDDMPTAQEIAAAVWNFPCRLESPEDRTYAETRPAAQALGDAMYYASDLHKALGDEDQHLLAAIRDLLAADRDAEVELTPEQVQTFADRVLAGLPASVHDAVRAAFARAGAPDAATEAAPRT